jgi:hypothetical protein
MDDDTTMDDGNEETVPTLVPKFKSTIMGNNSWIGDGVFDNAKRRGFRKETHTERNNLFASRK